LQISRDLATASGDVAYTGVGFQPTAMILVGSNHGSNVTSINMVDSGKVGKGMASTGGVSYADQTVALTFETAGGTRQKAIVKSFDADGFTLTWTKEGSPTGTAYISILCFR
jgi:hypothetical protein